MKRIEAIRELQESWDLFRTGPLVYGDKMSEYVDFLLELVDEAKAIIEQHSNEILESFGYYDMAGSNWLTKYNSEVKK